MKLDFAVFGRRALGRLLDRIAERFDRWQENAPVTLALASRQSREDLPRDEVVSSARVSATDFCWLRSPKLEVLVDWHYGPGESVPKVSGTIECSEKQLPACKRLLQDLSRLVGGTYGFCDLQQYVDPGTSLDPRERPAYAPYAHFPRLYWYNYFGPEYRESLPPDDSIRNQVSAIEESEDGGLVVTTRSSPKDAPDEARLEAIADAWPFFADRRPGASFLKPVAIDYSEIRSLPPAQRQEPLPVRAVVGDPDEFIAKVPAQAERFRRWMEAKGLSAHTEEDYLRVFQEHEAVIRDELLSPAIAAYGEVIRASMRGVWKKAALFHRGEPVVVRHGQPWTARRVILEVLQGLEP